MTLWDAHGLDDRMREILGDVRRENTHSERPFVSGYQLATELHRRDTVAFEEIDSDLGGVGIGKRTSVAQYLARVLSGRLEQVGAERVFLSHADVRFMEFTPFGDARVVSSNVDANFDLALFRLRE